MEPIRVLLATPSAALRTRIRDLFADAPSLVVVGESTPGVDLLLAAGETEAELVVLELTGPEAPGITSHLLAEYPQVKLLAVSRDLARATLFQLRPVWTVLPAGAALPEALLRELGESQAPWNALPAGPADPKP